MAVMVAILDFKNRMILAIFDIWISPVPQTKFWVDLFHGLWGVIENVKS